MLVVGAMEVEVEEEVEDVEEVDEVDVLLVEVVLTLTNVATKLPLDFS